MLTRQTWRVPLLLEEGLANLLVVPSQEVVAELESHAAVKLRNLQVPSAMQGRYFWNGSQNPGTAFRGVGRVGCLPCG